MTGHPIQLAEAPDGTKAVTSTIDKLLDQGVLGIVLVIFMGACFLLARQLLACLSTHAQIAASNAATIASDTAAKIAQAKAMEELASRMERLERRFDDRRVEERPK